MLNRTHGAVTSRSGAAAKSWNAASGQADGAEPTRIGLTEHYADQKKNTTRVRGLVRAPARLSGRSWCDAEDGLAAQQGVVRIGV